MIPLWTGIAIAVVGLAGVEALQRRAGGRAWPKARRNATLSALAALATCLAVGPRLGLRYGSSLTPRVAAAALFVLLVIYLWQLLPRLRPLLGTTLPQRPPLVFFLLPLVVYLALMPWSTAERPPDGDEPHYLLITHSLAFDFDAELTNNYSAEHSRAFVDRALEPQPHDPRGPNGEMYSRHNVLLPVLLAPAYRLAGVHGALAVMCLFAAALCWMTLRLARHLFPDSPGATLVVYFVLAFTSPLLLYSHQVWVEIPAALLLAVGLDAVLGMTADHARHPRAWLPLLLPLLLLPLLKIRFLLVAVPLVPMVSWRLGRRGRRLVVLGLAACGLLAATILLFNQLRYGNPLKYHDLSRLGFYWTRLDRYPRGLAGLFFDSAFGLFATAPIWALLLAPGSGKRRPLAYLAWVMTPYVVALIPRAEWYGAWSPPFRYGCVALPLFAFLLVPTLRVRHRAGVRLALGALGAATLALTALWVARPGWTYNIAHGRSHLVDFLTQAQGVDVARFAPSGVRPNLALWVWPVATVVLLQLLGRLARRPRPGATWLGAAAPVAAVALLTLAAHRLPTRIVEVEDPQVARHGGSLWPGDWVVGRTRFRGGWRLRPSDALTLPVVRGGRSCTIEIELRRFGEIRPLLQVRPGTAAPRTVRLPETAKWTTLRVEDVSWPPAARSLEIALLPLSRVDAEVSLLADRVHLRWSEGDSRATER